PTPTPTPTTLSADAYSETVTLGGSFATGITAALNAGLSGQVLPRTETDDATAAGFTGTATFVTPGGTVTAQYGGNNSFESDGVVVGRSNVVEGDLLTTSSTDPAIPVGGGGSFEDYGESLGLQYSSFGVWFIDPCAAGSGCELSEYIGSYGGANPGEVQTTSMPTTGSATYNGGAVGFVQQPVATNSTNVSQFWGSTSVTANFATGAVTGLISSIQAYDVSDSTTLLGTINNIGLSGNIAGSGWSGTTDVPGAAGTAFDISGATGTVTAGFYGPNADETAGVFNVTGGANNTTLFGGFGAAIPAVSDRRLKQDIEPVGTLPSGLALYAWSYLGSSHRFTGVMAQDLLEDA
ncbi:MAG: transferrin-binding protein-like solute binding protein, partial [Novosphingobium sp.]|nr:transferrin-binding protein-like solute binding protein [Novosphingobium sp.]